MKTKVEELFFCKNTVQWQYSVHYALAEKPEIVKWQYHVHYALVVPTRLWQLYCL